MIRVLALIFAFCVATGLAAQETVRPEVRVELSESETIPGQAVDLRVTILVPTWMTQPVVFPSFELINMIVRLPDRATTPVTEQVGGVAWSGVSRRYQVSPMVPGRFVFPEQEALVTWADPETNQPREDRVTISSVELLGKVPAGAEGLDPFLAATGLTLTQTIEGAEAPLLPGDSVTRKLVAKVEGTSPVFLPPLLKPEQIEGVSIYPSEPVLEEKVQRGEISGSRTESVTYLAQSGGGGQADAVSIQWFNLDTGKIETAVVDAVPLAVDAPFASDRSRLSPQILVLLGGGALVLIAVLLLLRRVICRRVVEWQAVRRARYMASSRFGRDKALAACKGRDLAGVMAGLDLITARAVTIDATSQARVRNALTALGAATYGDGAGDQNAAWGALEQAIRGLKIDMPAKTRADGLAPLNPVQHDNKSFS
ncbi:BatD family protein [Shimia biformata]|uniref:BatD family protein n=1 Tax=Shimia biformata TaxID=1294299 RepID=UPI0019523389|nr:BatD family protein [Shimia biformata]